VRVCLGPTVTRLQSCLLLDELLSPPVFLALYIESSGPVLYQILVCVLPLDLKTLALSLDIGTVISHGRCGAKVTSVRPGQPRCIPLRKSTILKANAAIDAKAIFQLGHY
jgi:hypothetical protein